MAESTPKKIRDRAGVPPLVPEPSRPAVAKWAANVVGFGLIGFVGLAIALMGVFGVYSLVEGIRQMVTQTAVTHNRHDPTPIPLTGAMAVLNGAVMATLGSLFLLPSLFLFRALWKKYCSKRSNRLDERNS